MIVDPGHPRVEVEELLELEFGTQDLGCGGVEEGLTEGTVRAEDGQGFDGLLHVLVEGTNRYVLAVAEVALVTGVEV